MRFSVIVPLYNKAAYVGKALQSVVDQTFQDWELIVVDDGSSDASAAVAEKFFKENGNGQCRLVRQENAGVSTARNNGVAQSKGEYIAFLDADDWWAPDFLEEMNQLIADFPDAGIYGTSYHIVKNGKNRIAPIAFDEGFEKGYIDYLKVYTRYLCMPLWTGAVSIHKTIFDEMQGFRPQLKLGEDFDLWLRIVLQYKVAMLNKPLAFYNQDIPTSMRATRNLHAPKHSEYFFYSQYENQYPNNAELKALLDKKRVSAMMGYHLSKEYAGFAERELATVDWSKQPKSAERQYHRPKCLLRAKREMMRLGSRVKQWIIKD